MFFGLGKNLSAHHNLACYYRERARARARTRFDFGNEHIHGMDITYLKILV